MAKYKLFGEIVVINAKEAKKLRATILSNYVYMQESIPTATEKQCFQALCLEMAGKQRGNILYRLHSALNRKRLLRERAQLKIKTPAEASRDANA